MTELSAIRRFAVRIVEWDELPCIIGNPHFIFLNESPVEWLLEIGVIKDEMFTC